MNSTQSWDVLSCYDKLQMVCHLHFRARKRVRFYNSKLSETNRRRKHLWRKMYIKVTWGKFMWEEGRGCWSKSRKFVWGTEEIVVRNSWGAITWQKNKSCWRNLKRCAREKVCEEIEENLCERSRRYLRNPGRCTRIYVCGQQSYNAVLLHERCSTHVLLNSSHDHMNKATQTAINRQWHRTALKQLNDHRRGAVSFKALKSVTIWVGSCTAVLPCTLASQDAHGRLDRPVWLACSFSNISGIPRQIMDVLLVSFRVAASEMRNSSTDLNTLVFFLFTLFSGVIIEHNFMCTEAHTRSEQRRNTTK